MTRPLRIGELAKLAGVTADTIRYYEQTGVLPPASRSAGGYRQYENGTVQRLRFVRRARALGLPLRDLKTLTALAGEHRASLRPRLLALVRHQLVAVRAQLAELRLLQRDLRHVAHKLASSHRMAAANGCRCLETGQSSEPAPGAQTPEIGAHP